MVKNKKKESFIDRKNNDWPGFLIMVVKTLVFTLIWALIGSNFYFLQKATIKYENLINLLPTDRKKPPYCSKLTPQSGGNGNSTGINKEIDINIDPKKIDLFHKITGFDKCSNPYKIRTQVYEEDGILKNFPKYFINWIADSIEFSYSTGRKMINDYLFDFFGSRDKDISSIKLLLSTPIILLTIIFTPVYGFISTLLGEFISPNKGWILTILFFFILGFDFWIAGSVAFVQLLQMFVTFILLPLYFNAKDVLKIISENSRLFTGFFGLLVFLYSMNYLKVEAVGVMGIFYIYLLYTNYKDWKSKQ